MPADATGLLYERHSRRIFGFCLSLLGSREEAEDAVQTTFLNAQRGLGRGVVPEFELAWLFKIARNVCHNRRQAAWRRGRVEAARDLDELQDVLETPERGSSVSIKELTRALGAIPERQRRALLLREFQGYSYEEIASMLGVSVSAVETLLFRARRSVADQLAQLDRDTSAEKRSVVASALALFRCLFKGSGTMPLKIAAATAVATTATLAVVPVLRDHDHGAAPVRSRLDSQRARVGDSASAGIARHNGGRAASKPRRDAVTTGRRTDGSTAVTPGATAAAGTTAKTPRPEHGASSVTSKGSAAPTLPAVTVPVPPVTIPDISVPKVELPPVELPTVELPTVDVPPVNVPPVDLPSGPDLPKLP